ncbi:hypothetical protein ScalyP_jg574 [Parmales sp. scaly parma]|nr:hypothetical protein ScalyP_jg574 [Parmales sp. scaly parma]
MTFSIPTGQLQDSANPSPDDKPGVQIVALTPPAATGPKFTLPAKPISKSMNMAAGSIGAAVLATRTAQSTLAVAADHLSSVSNIETETKKKKKKKKKKGKAAHREEGEKEKTMKMEFYFLLLILLLLSGVFATASATLIWTLDTSSSPATSSSVYSLTSTSTPTFLTTTTNVDVSSADIYVPVGGFLSHGVFYSSTERLEASLGLDHCMLKDDVEDGSHLNLTEDLPNFPDTASLTLRELETTAASDNEHSEANALFVRWNLLCLSIVLTIAGMMTTLSSNKARSCLCFCLERLSRAHISMRTRMLKMARQIEKSRESREWSLICYIKRIVLALLSFWRLTIAILYYIVDVPTFKSASFRFTAVVIVFYVSLVMFINYVESPVDIFPRRNSKPSRRTAKRAMLNLLTTLLALASPALRVNVCGARGDVASFERGGRELMSEGMAWMQDPDWVVTESGAGGGEKITKHEMRGGVELVDFGRGAEQGRRQLTECDVGSYFAGGSTRGLSKQKYSGDCSSQPDNEVLNWFTADKQTGTQSNVTSLSLGNEGSSYSYKFFGDFTPTESATYFFKTASDDGSWVFVNGELVVDNSGSHGIVTQTGSIDLVGGSQNEIVIVYGQGVGDDDVRQE